MKVGIIGGGIIGLCSAWYLLNEGIEVEIYEKGDGSDGCSFGNMGYLSPSHFVPLAAPGIVWQGIKWMFDPTSPFYIKPRADLDFMRWGYHFWRNATDQKVNVHSPALSDFLHLSRVKTIEMAEKIGNSFDLTLKGCYMMYSQVATEKHEITLAKRAASLGIEALHMDATQLQREEPMLGVNALGAVLYPIDGHLHPGKWLQAIRKDITARGAIIHNDTEIIDVNLQGKKIIGVTDRQGIMHDLDHLLVATGAWLPVLMKKLGLNLLMEAGKGYSTTFEGLPHNLSRPAILVDDRVALTPFGSDLRVGGTMELSGINHTIHRARVQAIINAVKNTFSAFDFTLPPAEKLWCGLRPVSPDGLPYLGNSPNYDNLTIAAGHAMLGISLAAGTGNLVSDLIKGCKPALNLHFFRINRY